MESEKKPERIYVLKREEDWNWVDDDSSPTGSKPVRSKAYLMLSSFVLDESGTKYVIETHDMERYSSKQEAGLRTEIMGYRPLLLLPRTAYMKTEYLAEDVL